MNKNLERRVILAGGPPFPSSRHIHAGTAYNVILKDFLLHLWRNENCSFQYGFDCHGLPIENLVNPHKNLNDETLIQLCKKEVNQNIQGIISEIKALQPVNKFLKNISEDHYKTSDLDYLSKVFSLFSKVNERELLIKDQQVISFCPRCETNLANHEITEKKGSTEYYLLRFYLNPEDSILITTKTFWNIPFNQAISFNPNLKYVKAKEKGRSGFTYFLKSFLSNPLLEIQNYEEIDRFNFKKYWAHEENFEKYLLKDLKVTDNFSGFVHLCSAHSEEDYLFLKKQKNKLEFVTFFDKKGSVISGKYLGENLQEVSFTQRLKEDFKSFYLGSFKQESTKKLCWRCESELFMNLSDSWFIDLKPALIKDLLKKIKKKVKVNPTNLNKVFQNYLLKRGNWCVSRLRKWGTPFPVWICESGHRYIPKNISELQLKSKSIIHSGHVEEIDSLKIPCPLCQKEMIREKFICDVWIDSSCLLTDYDLNFEKDLLLILEGKDQLKNYFQLLLLSTYLFYEDIPETKIYSHGWIMRNAYEKLSKSKSKGVFIESLDSDNLEDFKINLLSRPIGSDVIYDKSLEKSNECLKTFSNCLDFYHYLLLTERPLVERKLQKDPLTKKILRELKELKKLENTLNHNFETSAYFYKLKHFLVEILSRSYIKYFKSEALDVADKHTKLVYLMHYCLTELETTFKFFKSFKIKPLKLSDIEQSIYSAYVKGNSKVDSELIAVEKIISDALSLRQELKLNVKSPLKKIKVPLVLEKNFRFYSSLLKSVLNCKTISFNYEEISFERFKPEEEEKFLNFRLLKKKIQQLRKELNLSPGDSLTIETDAPFIFIDQFLDCESLSQTLFKLVPEVRGDFIFSGFNFKAS